MTHDSIRIILDEHRAVSAVLRSLMAMLERGPGDEPERFFDVVRAMLFYIDEFPERLHHPKESNLLFPKVARRVPALMPVIERLEREHMGGEHAVRELQHLLLAWELLGEARRVAFAEATGRYVGFYLEHMQIEEQQVLRQRRVVGVALGAAAVEGGAVGLVQRRVVLQSRSPGRGWR
jgi:hemerythrin-like domain-containing protein